MQPDLSDAFESATDVFLAKAILVEVPGGGCSGFGDFRWTFEKSGYWKGDESSIAYVHSECSEASCGFEFSIGQEYIVFSTYNGSLQALHTHLCTRTVESQWAGAALLEFLGAPNNVVATESTSWSTLKSRY